jgi:hypothetical protein
MKALIKLALFAAVIMPGLAISDEPNQEIESLLRVSDKLMAEDHRRAVKKIVVLPGASPASGAVTGSYQKETDGLLDGMDRGREIGVFRKDIGGIPISFPIPILTVPGMIFGGLSGTVKRQIQDFRDALTDDLAASAESPLSNDALATDVFWRLRDVSGLSPKVFALTTPIPEDTDAILYVSFSDSSIEVDGKVATITFTATATLRRFSDGQYLYENQVHYQDTDTLSNWTENENAAWRDYANYARHYVGREIVAELFERVLVQQVLLPEESETVSRIKKDRWRGVTRSRTPTLAWGLSLEDKGQQVSWAKTIGETDISYDVEIYDMHQLVYSAKNVAGQQHMVDIELEDCKTYRWSVRPSYKVDGAERYGEWMRSNPDAANGNVGKAAAEATAYIYDFASLEIKCGRR